MVVGAGISGIQAALDLANMGFKVFLVDKSPAIGGKMSQLDKTFPTNDCSMCIESPKFVETSRHPNINMMMLTDVDRVEGEAGDFRIALTKRPRFIRTDKCTGCTTCTQYCPINIPNKYNQSLSKVKASHIHFAQAVPLMPYIDPKECSYLKNKQCNICVGVCQHKAIDLDQKPAKVET